MTFNMPWPVATINDLFSTTSFNSTMFINSSPFTLTCEDWRWRTSNWDYITQIFSDLLLCHSFLNSNCIPSNNHFLRFLFLLLQLFFLRHTWAGKTETLANIMPTIIRLLLLRLCLNWIFIIVPVLKFQVPLKFEFFAIASNIHLQ